MKANRVICAWGKDTMIKELAKHATNDLLDMKSSFGLAYGNPEWAFRHPFPRVKERYLAWLIDMEKQLTI